MSTLAYSYSEPYKFPAGMLALIVHVAFFSLLYFGVNWRVEPPQGMVVDIWESLPAPQVEPVKVELPPLPQAEPPKPVEPPKLAEPIAPPKADIELTAKKMPKVKPQEPPTPMEVKPVQQTKPEPVKVEQKVPAVPDAVSELDRVRAAQAAATSKLVDEFKFKIMARIRRFIKMPTDVQDNMMAIFDVKLIPGGTVISSTLSKPSGNPAYDDAVDRAISRASPLPVPDGELFNRFRELHLTFTPKEKE